MFDNAYNQTLQDQIGQLSKLLGGQAPQQTVQHQQAETRYDIVDGIDGARAFLGKMLPSTKHIVWDGQKDTFYVLQKDANGTSQRIQICPFTVTLEQTPEERFVTKEDFNALVSRLDSLLAQKEGGK